MMQKYSYQAKGTCSQWIEFEVDGDVVKNIQFYGGCPGNLEGISALSENQKIDDLIKRLKGIQCRNGTSCPDQLAKALESVKNQLSLT